MTTDIFVIGHELEIDAKITFENRRLMPGEKQKFIQKLVNACPPRSRHVAASIISDDLGVIIDQGDKTLIKSNGRVFVNKVAHMGQDLRFNLDKGQEAHVHTRGYGPPIEPNATIGIRNR